jgi:hypothetical protein
MNPIGCGSMAMTQPAAQSYRRFRFRDFGRQVNERGGSLLNGTSILTTEFVWSSSPPTLRRFELPRWRRHSGAPGRSPLI